MVQEDDLYILKGPEPHSPFLDVTLGRLYYNALANCDVPYEAMVDGETGRTLSYKELFESSCILADYLQELGHGKQTIFSISSENNLEFFIPIFSSLFIGAIMAPLNHNYTPSELTHALSISKPVIIFCSKKVLTKYQQMQKDNPFIKLLIITDGDENVDGAVALRKLLKERRGSSNKWRRFQPVDGNPKELMAFILCSSGTTGLPKGVLLSQMNILVRLNHHSDPRYYSQDLGQTVISILPFFHGFGLLSNIGAILLRVKMVVLNRFEDRLFLGAIEKYRANILWMAPPLVVFLAKTALINEYNLTSIRQVTCGAAPLGKNIEDEVKRRLKTNAIFQGYGLTEATMAVTMTDYRGPFKHGSSGRVVSFLTCKVRDPETGKSLGPNQVGELCVKGPTVMVGYYNNPKATAESFTSDGWLRTGDLVHYDADGFVYIVDRLKELIKYKGFQVAPAELEALLLKMPKVRDVGVVGLPDEKSGELPLAFVVKHDGVSLTEKEVQDYVAKKLSPTKWLRGGVVFVSEIPKNPSGKILRRKLRDLLKQYKAKL